MDAHEHKSCLLKMPVLVLETILSKINNPANVARTCKYLYEIVCGMESHRRVMYISAFDATSSLNIDDDAVFDSIMNSHRTIKDFELRLDGEVDSSYELNERQLERMTAILIHFGGNLTSVKLHGFELPINFIVELLQQTTNLESISFAYGGAVMDCVKENTTMSLQLPRLKVLEIIQFPGLLDVVKLIPAGSLNSVRYTDQSTEVLSTILQKQHNTKSLTLQVSSKTDLSAIRIDRVQLESLTFKSCDFHNNIHFVEFLKSQTNLKEVRFISYYFGMSGRLCQWICNNLKNLEVLEVHRLDSIERNVFEMLGELKQLRHFRTSDGNYLYDNEFQSFQFKSDSIEKFDIEFDPEFSCERLNKMVNSMAHHLPNLTHLKIKFENFGLSMSSIVRAMPNLKSMSLLTGGLKFDGETIKDFVTESKSLEYLYVDRFELNRELSADNVIETIRCLTDKLKGYHFNFSTSEEDLHWHKIKEILSIEFYVRDNYWNLQSFYLYKGVKKPFSDDYF